MAHNSTCLSQSEPELNIDDVIEPDTREFLEIYSGINPTDVNVHVARIAKRGWEFILPQLPAYTRIVDRVEQGALFIDLGCGLGQDIRRLAYDGAPSENLVGLDLRNAITELGYDLFKDRDTSKARFISQDFFQNTLELRKMTGKAEIINSGLFMHLWDWAGQIRIGLHSGGGGRDSGNHKAEGWIERYVHNEMSFRQMWIEIERLTGARCKLALSAEEESVIL
ncbi:hypothetical protein BDV27DRAFT_146990 [Aspergillus caelatus]|uniref:Methyltransferase domain-containing protein n=1 Tax=Aspergillus caelatus TaxID=61420 RepID=A0A5N6ZZS0_9EURO|nr:uncharacterized protein BDV27DRAFT_146990 [Aspergillus caelatus]KAE8362429.1 hypothetical protein BDV27DRAFT_146990 [Aspergillus caelatus]